MSQQKQIIVNDISYLLLSPGVEDYCHTGNFDKIKNRSDNIYYLYESIGTVRKSIILFNKFTLSNFNNGGLDNIIALKQKPWKFDEILTGQAISSLNQENIANHSLNEVKEVLSYDSMTEGDSLRFFNYVVNSKVDMPSEVWPVLLLWLRDEQNHHSGFETVYKKIFGRSENEIFALESEPSNFEQFSSILSDPFKTLVALSYDEAATINGYLNDMPIYEDISSIMVKYVKRVISDEGWHLSKFAALTAKYWPERFNELDDVLNEAANADGKNYQRTFFLDHDPSVEPQFDKLLMDRAKRVAKKVILAKGKIKNFNDTSSSLDLKNIELMY